MSQPDEQDEVIRADVHDDVPDDWVHEEVVHHQRAVTNPWPTTPRVEVANESSNNAVETPIGPMRSTGPPRRYAKYACVTVNIE